MPATRAARISRDLLVPAHDHTPRLSDRGLGFGVGSPFRDHVGEARSGAHRLMVTDSPDVRNAFGPSRQGNRVKKSVTKG